MVIRHCETQAGGEKLPEKQTKYFYGIWANENKKNKKKIEIRNINTNKLKHT